MKILITGSSGFVGKHLVKKLSKKYEIVTYDLMCGQDVLNSKLLIQKLKGVDLVIHLAAFISATESWEKPMEYMRNNALGTLSVINCAINAGVKKMIYFSSAAVKVKPFTPYAVSKIAAEEIVKLYSDKIDTVIVRPENIYGPGQKEAYGYVIHNFIKGILKSNKVTMYGDGKQSRDFIYIDDIIKTVEKLIHGVSAGKIISLGTGRRTSVKNLALTVAKILKYNPDISYAKSRKEPRQSVADVKTLKSVGINYQNFINLNKGIKKLISIEYS